jgi:hypothetical protein
LILPQKRGILAEKRGFRPNKTIINDTDKVNVEPNDATQIAESAAFAGRSRTGKIARLPLALRQELNQRLQNGE